jgi:hypothetical protein
MTIVGYCNQAIGPEPCETGYELIGASSNCWFGRRPPAPVDYKAEVAQLFVTWDCYTGECANRSPYSVFGCEKCDRLRFLIGVGTAGASFFEDFGGGLIGWDSRSGGSAFYLFRQDMCGNTHLELLGQDNCISATAPSIDNCVPDTCDQTTNPIRPGFLNPCGNDGPVVTINEAP